MQLTAVNTISDSHDKAGDPATLGATTQTYDTASELASSSTSGTTTTYGYNPRGDRITATTSSAVTSYGSNQPSQLTSYTPPAPLPATPTTATACAPPRSPAPALLTIDPLVSQTQASYFYADDNPLNNTDPTGLIVPPGLWVPPSKFELGAGCDTRWGGTAGNLVFGLIFADILQAGLDPFTDAATVGSLEVVGDGFSASEKVSSSVPCGSSQDVVLREATGIGRTSDLLVNGTPYDVYTPAEGTSVRNILSRAASKWTQVDGGGVVIDLSNTGLSAADFGSDALAKVNSFINSWGGTPISNVTFYGG
jgi:YD repeat-containing protein